MPTKAKRRSSDRKRVSNQKHEIKYTGRKVSKAAGASGKAGRTAVKKAKRQTGTVRRGKVERRARELVEA